MLNITTCILTAVLTAGATPSEPRPSVTPASPGVNQALITHCQVFLIDDVHVPANATGALVTLSVRDGEPVRQGQLLAQTDDRQAQFDKLAAELKRMPPRPRRRMTSRYATAKLRSALRMPN